MQKNNNPSSYILIKNFRAFTNKFRSKFLKLSMPEYTIFSLYAIIIGIIAGLGAVLFHNSLEMLNALFFQQTTKGLYFLGTAVVIILPAIGMLIQSFMIKGFPKISKRKGVSDVIKAVSLRGGYISFRTTVFHFIAPAICIGTGGTLGPEGPAAQIGAGMASKIGNILGLSESKVRIFTAAGAAAAISAIFNSPLGGVFFALEIVLLNDFQTPTFSALILASVTGSTVSRIFLGNDPPFIFSTPHIGDYSNFYLYIIVGLFAGILSVLFIRYSSSIEHLFKNKIYKTIPQWLGMLIVGLLVGISGYFYSEIFGIGFKAINEILASSITWKVVLSLLVLKFVLVPLTLGSGGFGGMFAPSLFLGACFGYLFAYSVNYFWGLNLDPTIFILISMGAVLGGINTIPISSILIIFEMTQNYSFILPLMLAVIISTTLVQMIIKGSVHVKHLEAEGYRISEGKEHNILKSIKVSDVELNQIELLDENTPLPKLVAQIIDSPHSTFYTVNDEGKINGTITELELRPIITEYDTLKNVIVAKDVINPKIITVDISDNLDYVLKLFSKKNLDQFPVINKENPDKILGAISRQQVLRAYNHESLKYNLADGLSTELRSIEQSNTAKIVKGFSIVELKVPLQFTRKTLSEIKLRNKYNVEVLMIKKIDSVLYDDKKEKIIIPDPNYVLQRDDLLVLFGQDDRISEFVDICKNKRTF
ncbi:MAG: chloride channel protein [Bacteroidetes bacterium]|nr:chloride channel protein [Bacteroidota bacterium]